MSRSSGIVWLLLLTACGGASPAPAPTVQPAHDHHARHSHEPDDHFAGPQGHRFEHADEWAPRFDDPERDAWQRPDLVVKHLSLSDGMTVADLGAGTGYFLPHLSRAVGTSGKVLGLDVEPDMVRYMNERAAREQLANVQARVVGTDDPELAAASVDRILIVDTWHHIGARAAYAGKLAAALKPGGAVYIVDFTMETERGPPPKHRLRSADVIAELTAAGLRAELIAEDLPDQYIVVGRKQ
ncbi:MAG TPA: methyltransferase domain-containing protein [Kofleriaceae bacterium]|nr:methyltransferase domain-containing protein [Kofleriaceae bacterium]